MEKETVQYKRTVRGSVGAGVGALFNGSGRQFFILEHRNSSKFHKAGESQKIIVDQIELGRDGSCQVRFDDESFPTVSRKHAAIEKDEHGWKIIPLSQTNSTLVNGRVVNSAWYLQNGDEIQLSKDGPKLGFIVPAGKQSLVSSIKLTERLNLFRQQALRPYKRAIAAMIAVLIAVSGVGGYMLYDQSEQITNLKADNNKMQAIIRDTKAEFRKKEISDSIDQENNIKKINHLIGHSYELEKKLEEITGLQPKIAAAKKHVYAVITEVRFTLPNGEVFKQSSQGTGFLLDDGRFVTARHCVQPWMYDTGELMKAYALSRQFEDVTLSSTITAYSTDGHFTIPGENFTVDESNDICFPYTIELGDDKIDVKAYSAMPIKYADGSSLGSAKMFGSDWAYAQVNQPGGLSSAKELSNSLKAGTEVHVLGFPAGLGIMDGKTSIEPIYNKMTVSRDGLNDAHCIMVSEGVAHGNSGGPVFAIKDGDLQVIAIVSRKEGQTQQYGTFGIVQQQQQYDQLVPLSNLK